MIAQSNERNPRRYVFAALLTTLYGLQNTAFIPQYLFSVGFSGVVVATACYLLTEFALRPVAAQDLHRRRRLRQGLRRDREDRAR